MRPMDDKYCTVERMTYVLYVVRAHIIWIRVAFLRPASCVLRRHRSVTCFYVLCTAAFGEAGG